MQGLVPEILGHALFYICVLLFVFDSNHGKTHNLRFTIFPALKYAVQWCYIRIVVSLGVCVPLSVFLA